VCYANNGTATPGDGSCTITQGPSGTTNIAVCVQVTSAAQQCDIRQINDSYNNYALIIQRIDQQGAGSNCPVQPPLPPPIPPCQNATQRASILQADGTGSDFGGVIQKVNQSLSEQASDPDPQQFDRQEVRSLTGPYGLQQTSGVSPSGVITSSAGSNYAAVGEASDQSQAGATAQSQEAHQFVGYSESGQGINQTVKAPGGANAGVLWQVQKQNLQSGVATSQSEKAYQDGDITEDDGAGSNNFASGNQFQDQVEQGVSTTHQLQFGDPKCCSALTLGGTMQIRQATNMFANNPLFRNQTEIINTNCDAPPAGCTAVTSATVNGTTTQGPPCNGQPSCHQGIVCFSPGPCTPCRIGETSGTLPFCSSGVGAANFSFGNRALAIAQTGSGLAMRTPTTFRSARLPAARSAPSDALLT
jgi:hypothetical protein